MRRGVFDGSKTNSVRIDGAEYLITALQSLGEVGGKYLRGAIQKGINVVEPVLLANTPVGPTGNLRKAVGHRTVYYRNSLTAFGVVGYKRAVSTDTADARGFHSHFIEFGTADRTPKRKPFLSSYGISDWTPPGWSGRWPMFARRVRGVRAAHPLGMAFVATSGQALAVVLAEMERGLERAQAEVARGRG